MGAFFACSVHADVSMLVHRVVTGNVEHLKQSFSNISHLVSVCVCVPCS